VGSAEQQRRDRRRTVAWKKRDAAERQPRPPSPSTVRQIAELQTKIASGTGVHEAVRSLGDILCREIDPPVQQVVESNVCGALVQLLDSLDVVLLKDVLWCLSNVMAGTHAQCEPLVRCGIAPRLIALLGHSDDFVRDQAVWAVGNLSGDCEEWNGGVLLHGGMERVAKCARHAMRLPQDPVTWNMIWNCAWTMSNMARNRGGGRLALNHATLIVSMMTTGTLAEQPGVVEDAGWAMAHASDDESEDSAVTNALVSGGLAKVIVNVMRRWEHGHERVVTPYIRILGNLSTGSDESTERVVAAGALDVLLPFLRSRNGLLRREVCWTLSNLAVGSPSSIVAAYPGLVGELLGILQDDRADVRREACWVIFNVCRSASRETLSSLVAGGVIPVVCRVLSATLDVEMKTCCLATLNALLEVNAHEWVEVVEEHGGRETIESLSTDRNASISALAAHMCDTYMS